jgi:hypothetical protein
MKAAHARNDIEAVLLTSWAPPHGAQYILHTRSTTLTGNFRSAATRAQTVDYKADLNLRDAGHPFEYYEQVVKPLRRSSTLYSDAIIRASQGARFKRGPLGASLGMPSWI